MTKQPDLHERLKQARAREGLESGPDGQKGLPVGPWGIGLRAGVEVVSALVVGIGIGWLLDRWLGISPWGLIVFLLLGFAAGVLNVMRAAGVNMGSMGPKAPD